MRKTIKTLDGIKDSQIMFDKNPPAFGYILIVIITVFLALALVFSIRTPKIYTILAQGILKDETSNYVMCGYTGEVNGISHGEGDLVKKGDVLFQISSNDYDVQLTQLEGNKTIYETQVKNYELLVKSIKDDRNYFNATSKEDNLYYSMYETYKSQIAQNTFDATQYKTYGYSDEQIKTEIERNQAKLLAIYYESISSAEKAVSEAKFQIEAISAQIKAIEEGRDYYKVKATTDGRLHWLGSFKDGMVVQATSTVASISPENAETVMETYISASDRSRIEEGDSVQIVIDGLSQNVFGSLKGKIKQIDSNITTQQGENGQNAQYFKTIISLDKKYLIDRNGNKVDIFNGMTAVGRIQYDKITYFDYVLEKIGIKVK